ncbi:hypothetical protein Nepgr_005767 [Nepenthes gracilis]|uniref:Uncharacterized protein n=1 Tax=Nepenthes gracilis TaxID=150966 RepID=A0AAD3XGS1_NEPGR|nr:hypothetical protein Nepgr_005767 [Nepenthes gracilis]
MGNAASCAPSIASNGAIKVLKWDGRIEAYTRPVKAEELMLEHPEQFVCDPSSLQVGHRIPGLPADDELEFRRLYFLLPTEMLYSVLTREEMGQLTSKASKALKHASSFRGRIFPAFADLNCILPNSVARQVAETEPVSQSYSSHRSWKPALETIVEAN